MFYSGVAQDGVEDFQDQIRAHQEIGWEYIEIKSVEGINLTDVSDEKFNWVCQLLQDADMKVSCFSAKIGCHSISTPFDKEIGALRRSVERMRRLNTPFIRIMSYQNDGLDEAAWEKEVIRRVKELARIAEDGSVVLVHENCAGWGGKGPEHTLELLAEVNSPALKLVWDTGNPVNYRQDPIEYFEKVKEHIVYVHVKDMKRCENNDEVTPVYPGEGGGKVREIITRLIHSGYDGGFSIEPHFQMFQISDTERYASYVEYGRRFMKLMDELLSDNRVPEL